MQEFRETVGIAGFSACSFADLFCIFLHYSAKKYTDVHKNGKENGFLYQNTIDENYPQRDFHTMYVGKIEKVLVRDDEYLK